MKTTHDAQATRAKRRPRAGRLLGAMASALGLMLATTVVSCDPAEFRTEGCEDASFRPITTDAWRRGPWQVGVRTVEVKGMKVEVWYPAYRTSSRDLVPATYDLRNYLDEEDRARLPKDESPVQTCDCYRDLAIDTKHGPYPAVLYVPSQAGIRTQSLPQMVHWASRGFVVLAADIPGLRLRDALERACTGEPLVTDIEGDVRHLLDAIRGPSEALAFLGDHIDTQRIGLVGHSAGGNALATLGDEADVIIPMAARGVEPTSSPPSTLILGGTADEVMPFVLQRQGYAHTPRPKRLVGIRNAGHLSFTELCSLRNEDGDDLLQLAADAGICGAAQLSSLYQCSPNRLPDEEAWDVINRTTAAVLEETLHCDSYMAETFERIEQRQPNVAVYREQL